MYSSTVQNVTYLDYSIRYPYSPSTKIEGLDVDIVGIRFQRLSSSRSLRFGSDLSSIWPRFEMKNETSLIETEVAMEEKASKIITEEDIALAMVEHDFVVKIPPKKRYKIQVLVRSIKKGEPRAVGPNEFLL